MYIFVYVRSYVYQYFQRNTKIVIHTFVYDRTLDKQTCIQIYIYMHKCMYVCIYIHQKLHKDFEYIEVCFCLRRYVYEYFQRNMKIPIHTFVDERTLAFVNNAKEKIRSIISITVSRFV